MFDTNVQTVMDRVDALRDQVDDHWQIPRDEALVLAQLVRLGACRSICEIGTSYGFSTLHLAAAAREQGGHLHAFERDPKKIEHTRRHLDEAGLSDVVTLHEGDARQTVAAATPQNPYDFVFIDAVKEQCFEYLDAVWPKLAPRCALATDNTGTHPEQLRAFVEHLRAHPELSSCDVPVGNGFELSLRRA
ncbi:MAG: O-methyltransferase [Phycisphaeraceae bacterium]